MKNIVLNNKTVLDATAQTEFFYSANTIFYGFSMYNSFQFIRLKHMEDIRRLRSFFYFFRLLADNGIDEIQSGAFMELGRVQYL